MTMKHQSSTDVQKVKIDIEWQAANEMSEPTFVLFTILKLLHFDIQVILLCLSILLQEAF